MQDKLKLEDWLLEVPLADSFKKSPQEPAQRAETCFVDSTIKPNYTVYLNIRCR